MAVTRLRCALCCPSPYRPTQAAPLPSSSSRIRFSSTSTSTSTATQRPEDPRWPGYRPTIGLELHVQLRGNPKLFSPAKGVYDAEPNKHVARFDAALPGSLPVLHPPTLRLALLAALALDCNINRASTFDRKHYFYPDLPSGFQVTQKYSPLAKDGLIRVRLDTASSSNASKSKSKKNEKKGGNGVEEGPEYVDVRIEQVQLEQDTAKSFHDPSLPSPSPPSSPSSSSSSSSSPSEPPGGTLIDLNRAGTALVEIVTKPDLRTPEEAGAFVRSLQRVLRFVGASRGGMEKGELRCDVNVSVAPAEALEGSGTRCEVKNLNGVKFVMGAIEAEIHRQIASLSSGTPIVPSTLGYSPLTHQTFVLRTKESAPDYRYMPDPELGVVRVEEAELGRLRAGMAELPERARERLMGAEYGLGERDAGIVVALGEADVDAAAETESGVEGEGEGEWTAGAGIGVRWFEEVVAKLIFGEEVKERARQAANWLINDLLGHLSRHSLTLARSPVKPAELAELIDAVKGGRVTGTNAKQLLREYIALHAPPRSTPPSAAASAASPSPASAPSSFSAFLAPHLSAPPSLSSPSSSSSSASSPSSSSSDLAALIQDVIAALPAEAAKVRAGQEKVLMRLVGEAMKRSRGKADARKVQGELRRVLLGEGGGRGQKRSSAA
ncbi:hypothetical protein JCM6882_004084 [Rhodosporidiobolus microsporus]